MNYDLSVKEDRKKFIKRANALLKSSRPNVALIDESNKTPNQNAYIHVLCRIIAEETGTSEYYAKQVYFKEIANNELFIRITKDSLTNQLVKTIRSICDLTIPELSRAINRFIKWAAEQGYILPKATVSNDGSLCFDTDKDQAMYHQALIHTSKLNDL